MQESMQRLLEFLGQLHDADIFYRLSHRRPETIMVEATVPGERWEIEFFASGNIEVERFVSGSEGVLDGAGLREFWKSALPEFSEELERKMP